MKEYFKEIKKNGLVLDVGCAGGRDAKKFIKNGFKVIGIDLVDEFLKTAKQQVPQAKFIKMGLLNLKFPNNYFDAIWANAVLLHINKKDIPKVLESFFKITKPEGMVHIRLKRGNNTKIIVDKLSQNSSRQFTLFYKYELEQIIRKSGFKIIKSRIFKDEANRQGLKWLSIWCTKKIN